MAEHGYLRWYDKDPALSKAMEALRTAPNRYQAQVAINIVKVILEQKLERDLDKIVDDETIRQAVEEINENEDLRHRKRRWYDVNETLRAAMALLEDTPEDMHDSVVPSVVTIIEQSLVKEW